MADSEKTLTPSQRTDKLLSRLKLKAIDLRSGRFTVDVIVSDGHIVRLELTKQTETWIAE